jgi:DNA-binding MurR/RpiR family transcriptional regulator
LQSAQYLVVIEVLNRPHGRELERMYRTLRAHDRQAIDEAVASLEQAGVVTVQGRTVKASAALARLEQLDLIAV